MKTRRIVLLVALGAVLGGALFAWLMIRERRPQLELGVGYAARVACGCRYIGNRTLDDCRKDFEPGMEAISLSEDSKAKAITASIPLIAHRTVRFDPVLGCQAEPFTGAPLTVRH